MNSFDMSAAPEVTAEDGEKVRQVAFSSGEQQRAGPQREKGIIFHGGRLVSVGVSDGGKCEQLNIISECCAVWWFYMLLGVPDAHLSHTHIHAHTHTHTHMRVLRYPCWAMEHNGVYPLWPSQFESEVGLARLSWCQCCEVQPKP